MENKVSPGLALRLARMEGAHMNGNEAMPLWFAAVVSTRAQITHTFSRCVVKIAGNLVGMDHRYLNVLAAS